MVNRLAMGMNMRKVTVRKEELLRKLEENRTLHVKEYLEACEGYREVALTALATRKKEIDAEFKRNKELLENGSVKGINFNHGVSFNLKVPISHEKDYDVILAMTQAEVSETVELDTAEFQQYWLDQWDWQAEFTASTAAYKK